MAVNVASGYPQYSGAPNRFIPEVWSGKLLVKFYAALSLNEIANTDYEGEIKDVGDKVYIRTIPTITISDYTKGMTLSVENPQSTATELTINKAKYFNFICDDIDKYQSDIKLMNEWSNDAGMQMKITIETAIWADIYSSADSNNYGTTAGLKTGAFNLGTTGAPIAITKTNIIDYLIDLETVLDEQNVPEENRWVLIPPFVCGMIMKSDLKDASMTGDSQSIIRNGRLGKIGNFALYRTNVLTSVTDGSFTAWNIMAGQKSALSFAAQMTKTETVKSTTTFGQLVRGLNVYGYSVLKDDALAVLYARKG